MIGLNSSFGNIIILYNEMRIPYTTSVNPGLSIKFYPKTRSLVNYEFRQICYNIVGFCCFYTVTYFRENTYISY